MRATASLNGLSVQEVLNYTFFYKQHFFQLSLSIA